MLDRDKDEEVNLMWRRVLPFSIVLNRDKDEELNLMWRRVLPFSIVLDRDKDEEVLLVAGGSSLVYLSI